jgi:sugar phosphate isomerase/epimerase
MLLTLTASCLKSMLGSGRGKKPKLDLLDLPVFTRETLGLSGVNLSTELLVGADRTRLETFRERADRASCSCLLLIEADAQLFGSNDEKVATGAAERMLRVVEAAQILGCSAAAVRVEAPDDDQAMARVALRLRPVMERAEKLDINLLVSPTKGLTLRPERVTELLKKVGGFRIGTFPDFQTAAESKDPASYLHRLTPYATAVCAATIKFVPVGKGSDAEASAEAMVAGDVEHSPYALKPLIDAVISVGYDGPLALDYRGGGDVTMGLSLSRDAMLAALGDNANE